MLGFNNKLLTIEKCTHTDLRGIPTYAAPTTAYGYAVVKHTFDYSTGKTTDYLFVALQEPNLVKKEDKINGYKVDSVKPVYIDGEFIVCEVTCL